MPIFNNEARSEYVKMPAARRDSLRAATHDSFAFHLSGRFNFTSHRAESPSSHDKADGKKKNERRKKSFSIFVEAIKKFIKTFTSFQINKAEGFE